jgi:hypothetical protein
MSLPPYERPTKQTLGTSGPTFMRENGTSSAPIEKQGAIADRGNCAAGRRMPLIGGNGIPKKREMKEGPTMLLIIKGRFWEPTMFMKINELA